MKSDLRIGYIVDRGLSHTCGRFKFVESSFTRRISSKSDTIRSKILLSSVDYEEIVDNANIMKRNSSLILVREPFLLDDELKARCQAWCDFANKADPKEYDPFA